MATPRKAQPERAPENHRALETESFYQPLDRHRLVIVCVKGNVSVRETLRTIIQNALGPRDTPPLLVLGPTAPEDIANGQAHRIGWVTFVDGTSLAHQLPDVEIISPDNLLEVNLFIKKDIHDRAMVETVKRFADVVLEFRDQDDEAGLKVEMRTLNFADNIYTSWRPFNDWLRPISVSA